jgi:hypothetical protein
MSLTFFRYPKIFEKGSAWIKGHKNLLGFLLFFLLSTTLSFARADDPFVSQWDELYHLSYVQYVTQGTIPANGYPMNDWSKSAFSCYPVSLIGMTTDVPCGELGAGSRYPTGGTNTAALWPPVYYILTAAIMIPVTFLLGIDGGLFAARYATGIIWALGISLLSLIILRKSRSFVLGAIFSLLSTSLSLFGQSASFVSPHSTVPLLLALGLMLSFWLEGQVSAYKEKRLSGPFPPLGLIRAVGLWLAVAGSFGLLVGLTVPHSFPLLLVIGVFVFLGVVGSNNLRLTSKINWGFATILVSGLSLIGFLLAYRFWGWQLALRSVDYPADVNTAAMDIGVQGSYPSRLEQVLSLWWEFWPQGLSNPWLQGTIAIFVENFWIFVLPALIITALATLGIQHWLTRISLGLIIAAPIASNLAFLTLQISLPERYGLVIVLLGLFGIANENIGKVFRVVLLVAAISTYILGFFYNPLPFAEAVCPPGSFTWQFGCVLP